MAELKEARVPDIGGYDDVPVIEVLVAVGDTVAADQGLVTLESDKATMEVPAPFAGVVRELKVKVGDSLSEGGVVALIEPAGAAGQPATTAAAEPKKAPNAQQERMKECNTKAADKKGDERKKYMSACLKGEDAGPSAKQKAQQNKMTACNKEAGGKNLKGDERKKFMSACLKG